jgi:hypothetical protein
VLDGEGDGEDVAVAPATGDGETARAATAGVACSVGCEVCLAGRVGVVLAAPLPAGSAVRPVTAKAAVGVGAGGRWAT